MILVLIRLVKTVEHVIFCMKTMTSRFVATVRLVILEVTGILNFLLFRKWFYILVRPPTATLVEKILSVLTVGHVTSRAPWIDFIIKMGPMLKPMLSAHVSDLRIRFMKNLGRFRAPLPWNKFYISFKSNFELKINFSDLIFIGYYGDRCENFVCTPNPCENSGTCSGRRKSWPQFSEKFSINGFRLLND